MAAIVVVFGIAVGTAGGGYPLAWPDAGYVRFAAIAEGTERAIDEVRGRSLDGCVEPPGRSAQGTPSTT